MKFHKHIICLTLLALSILLTTGGAAAQSKRASFDTDIRDIRSNAAPGFNCQADDYLQYSPAAVLVALKACGYESRTGWGQMLTADAFSAAIMVGLTQGLKYSIDRQRPNGGNRSFPSGHTATAFMLATMLHKEYGWRSPWFSIGGFTIAAYTGVSRMLNDKHWMSDVATGAAIGIGSVHLGYYLSDMIFKNKYINPAYQKPTFDYDPTTKHYVAEILFGRRFPFGESGIRRGGVAGLSTDIPVIPGAGVSARACANSLSHTDGTSTNLYSVLAGGYYNYHFARRFELQAKAMAGYGRHMGKGCADIAAGAGLSFMLDDNFKIKAFAEYETISLAPQKPWMHSVVLGWTSSWCF